MSDPTLTAPPLSSALDPRVRDLLRDLSPAQAAIVDDLVRERDRLVALAERRAERLQRLQEASATMSRSLDRDDIERELARQVARMITCDGVVIARPRGDGSGAELALHWRNGREERTEETPGCAAIEEVTRSGRSARSDAPACLAIPLLVGYKLTAVVAVYGGSTTGFGAEEEELLQTLGATAATALVNASLYSESIRDKRQAEALAAMASSVGASLRMHDALRLSLRHAAAILGSEGAAVSLRKGEFLHVVATEGAGIEALAGVFVPIADSPPGLAMVAGRSYLANGIDQGERPYESTGILARIRQIVSAPLLTTEGPIGLIAVANRETPFTPADLVVLERLAAQLSLAIVNARLYEEASEATRELSVAFDAIAGGMAVLDSDGFILRHNARLQAMTALADGYPLVGRGFYEAVLHEPRELSEEEPVGIAVRGRSIGRGILRPAWSGKVLDVVASPHPAGGAVVTVDDVTSFHALQDRHRDLVEVAADAIYTLDPDGIFTSANAAAEALTGAPRATLVGQPILPMIGLDEIDVVRDHFRAALAGETRRYQATLVRSDGDRRLVQVSNTPIRRGTIVEGVLGVARDVTDERAQAVALEHAEARYTRLIESAEDAICTVDEEGNFTSVNRAMERALGRSREALLGAHFASTVSAREATEMWARFASVMSGERQRYEFAWTGNDGLERRASVNASPIYEGGRITGALAIIRDVTEERALFDQVSRREKLAALGELVGGVAHEVNTPLTGILAFGQILQARPDADDDMRKATDTIVNEAKRAARIVGKLLTFARQNPPEKMPTELNQVLLDTIELRRYPLKMQQIALSVELASGLPVTWADPFQLQQVFINLLSNAEQALANRSGERRITVRTELRDGQLVATILDTGPGIPPEHLPHIFNPFYTTKPRGIGTGLGLAISFGIVREHRGVVRVVPASGHGAAFEVSLPVVASPSSSAS